MFSAEKAKDLLGALIWKSPSFTERAKVFCVVPLESVSFNWLLVVPLVVISKITDEEPVAPESSSPQVKTPLFQAKVSPSSEHSFPVILKADPRKYEAEALVHEPVPTVYKSPEIKRSLG